MPVTIVGPGPLGIALGGSLIGRGYDLRYVGRAGPVAVRATLDTPDGSMTIATPAPDLNWMASTRVALVAVKAFDLEGALESVLGSTREGTVVIPVSNGAVEDLVRQAAAKYPRHDLRFGFCTVGVSEVASQHYALRSKLGELAFGPVEAVGGRSTVPLSSVDAELSTPKGGQSSVPISATPKGGQSSVPISFVWHGIIVALQRRKWIYNVVINSLTAARGLKRNGDLSHDLPMLTAVFHEACALATAMWGELPLDRQTLYQGLEQLIERTSDNENSMARDRRLGRRTESAFLAGLAKDQKAYPLLHGLHKTLSDSV